MQKIPAWLDKVVLYGILFSLALVLAGGLWYLKDHAFELAQIPTFADHTTFQVSVKDIIGNVFSYSPIALIQAGLLSLALVQIMRVLFIGYFFGRSRDYLFTLMCGFILGVLVYGLC